MTSAFRRQGQILIAVFAGYLVVAAGVNLLVNPLRVIPARCSLEVLEPFRDINRDVRTGKAGLVRYHQGVEIAIVGSSRFEIGLDPQGPAFQGHKTLNVAMAAGTLTETLAMVRYLVDRQPELRCLIFGIELGDLTSDDDSRTFTSFYASPLADTSFSVDRELRFLVGVTTLEQSLTTLGHAFRKVKSTRNPFGLWTEPEVHPDVRNYMASHREVIFAEIPDLHGMRIRTAREAKINALRTALLELRQRQVRVCLTLPPEMALKQIHPTQDSIKAAPWEVDRRAIFGLCREVNAVAIPGAPAVELWDFNTFHPLTTPGLPPVDNYQVGIPNWYDLGHFNTTLGNLMAERLFSKAPLAAGQPLTEQFGLNVLAVGLEPYFEALKTGHARYCHEHSNDVAWVRSILPKFDSEPAAPSHPSNQ